MPWSGELDNGYIIWPGEEKGHQRVVGYLLNAKAKLTLHGYRPVNFRIIGTWFNEQPLNLLVIQTHAPTTDSAVQKRKSKNSMRTWNKPWNKSQGKTELVHQKDHENFLDTSDDQRARLWPRRIQKCTAATLPLKNCVTLDTWWDNHETILSAAWWQVLLRESDFVERPRIEEPGASWWVGQVEVCAIKL